MLLLTWMGLIYLLFMQSCQLQTPAYTLKIDRSISQKPTFLVQFESSEAFKLIDQNHPEEFLKICTVHEGKASKVSILGTFSFAKQALLFQPRFEFEPGLIYQIQYGSFSTTYTIPHGNQEGNAPLKILTIYPNTDTIPSNLLVFYIHFSQSMNPSKSAFKSVVLLDENDAPITRTWREKSYWIDGDSTLVLMIHPGRVKNGISSTSELGDLFPENRVRSLLIKDNLQSKNGQLLQASLKRKWHVGPIDHQVPKLLSERLQIPKAGTKTPLVFSFSEPMDYGLLKKWVTIRSNGTLLAGWLKHQKDAQWAFVPDKNWQPGTHELVLHNKLADLAHNQLDRLFEVTKANALSYHAEIPVSFKIEQKQ